MLFVVWRVCSLLGRWGIREEVGREKRCGEEVCRSRRGDLSMVLELWWIEEWRMVRWRNA